MPQWSRLEAISEVLATNSNFRENGLHGRLPAEFETVGAPGSIPGPRPTEFGAEQNPKSPPGSVGPPHQNPEAL